MSKVLKEYFGEVRSSDAHQYGYGSVRNYLDVPYEANAVDWVITNPPFRLAEEFVQRSLIVAKRGVAVLVRTVFIESIGRYQNLFEDKPPSIFAQYTERVPMVRGRLDRKASTATGYAWLVWRKGVSRPPTPDVGAPMPVSRSSGMAIILARRRLDTHPCDLFSLPLQIDIHGSIDLIAAKTETIAQNILQRAGKRLAFERGRQKLVDVAVLPVPLKLSIPIFIILRIT